MKISLSSERWRYGWFNLAVLAFVGWMVWSALRAAGRLDAAIDCPTNQGELCAAADAAIVYLQWTAGVSAVSTVAFLVAFGAM